MDRQPSADLLQRGIARGLPIHCKLPHEPPLGHRWTGMGGDYDFFHAEAEVGSESGNNLPHWRQGGVIYFVTFRLADSLPKVRLEQMKAERADWLKEHPEPRSPADMRAYHRLFTARRQRWLDEGHGECSLKILEVRSQVEAVLRHFDGSVSGYALDEFVIMPNHVHALVAPKPEQSLSEITRAWKSVSAHRINKLLSQRGPLWQEESWDHIVRSERHLNHYRQYIQDNPKALPRVS